MTKYDTIYRVNMLNYSVCLTNRTDTNKIYI